MNLEKRDQSIAAFQFLFYLSNFEGFALMDVEYENEGLIIAHDELYTRRAINEHSKFY